LLVCFFPQWQGAGNLRVHRGAKALWESWHLTKPHISVPVSLEEGGNTGTSVKHADCIDKQLKRGTKLLKEKLPDRTLTVGGGCDIEGAMIPYLLDRHGPLQVFWLDAHADLNSPESSPSGLFHGMVLRYLLEPETFAGCIGYEGKPGPMDLHLWGLRDLDPAEKIYIAENEISVLSVNGIRNKTRVFMGGSEERRKAYVHIDLDVLDPAAYAGVECPAPCGLTVPELADLVEAIKLEYDVVGMSILENIFTEESELLTLKPLLRVLETVF
jgi:arginase